MKIFILSSKTTSWPDSTSLLALSRAVSEVLQWSSTGSSKVEEKTSPLTLLLISVTSSGLSPIKATINLTSGAFFSIEFALSFNKIVFPGLGGATTDFSDGVAWGDHGQEGYLKAVGTVSTTAAFTFGNKIIGPSTFTIDWP